MTATIIILFNLVLGGVCNDGTWLVKIFNGAEYAKPKRKTGIIMVCVVRPFRIACSIRAPMLRVDKQSSMLGCSNAAPALTVKSCPVGHHLS